MAKVRIPGGGGARDSRRDRPNLTPQVLNNAQVAVLEVHDAQTGIVANGRPDRALLSFMVQGTEHVLWLTVSGLLAVVQRYGDEDTEWKGKRVPLVLVDAPNPQTGQTVRKYWVADADDWDDLLQEQERRTRKPARKRAKTRRRK